MGTHRNDSTIAAPMDLLSGPSPPLPDVPGSHQSLIKGIVVVELVIVFSVGILCILTLCVDAAPTMKYEEFRMRDTLPGLLQRSGRTAMRLLMAKAAANRLGSSCYMLRGCLPSNLSSLGSGSSPYNIRQRRCIRLIS